MVYLVGSALSYCYDNYLTPAEGLCFLAAYAAYQRLSAPTCNFTLGNVIRFTTDTLDALTPDLESRIEWTANRLAAKIFGTVLNSYTKLKLPTLVTKHDVIAFRTKFETVINNLNQDDIKARLPTIARELAEIQQTIAFGHGTIQHPVKDYHTPWASLSAMCSLFQRFYEYMNGTDHPPPPSPLQTEIMNITNAFNRLKTYMSNLSRTDKKFLSWQPCDTTFVPIFKTLFKHEVKILTFNVATILTIQTIALGMVGIIGFKTMILACGIFYMIRRAADKSITYSLSNVPLPFSNKYLPFSPSVVFEELTTNYALRWLANKCGYIDLYYLQDPEAFMTEKTEAVKNVLKLIFSGEKEWRPNLFAVYGCVILKNQVICPKLLFTAFKLGCLYAKQELVHRVF